MKRILIAEDDPASRELLAEVLRGLGYEVAEACDGAEVLQKVGEFAPELVLLDIQMPVLDGFAVLRHLRSHPRLAELPVLAVTAYAMRGDREKTLEAGFDGYVSKPVDVLALKSELDRHLGVRASP